jgi:brefeldin A-resistance guanine nucleotide exchange factor 1
MEAGQSLQCFDFERSLKSQQMIEVYLNLFMHSLLPAALLEKEEFLGGTSAIPLQGTIASPVPVSRPEAGLLSALSSYLMTPYGSTSEPILPQATQSEIENALCAVDCITACRIDEFYTEIM